MLWILLVVVIVAGIALAVRSRAATQGGRVDPSGMRMVASFHGPAFAQAEAAEDQNPQSWGEALLREVMAHVKAPFEVVTLHAPSYGHAATVKARGHTFTVSVGFVDESDGWLLFVDGSRTLAPVPDVDETRDLLRQLHAGLGGIEGLSEVRWADRTSFDRNDPAWQSSPLA